MGAKSPLWKNVTDEGKSKEFGLFSLKGEER